MNTEIYNNYSESESIEKTWEQKIQIAQEVGEEYTNIHNLVNEYVNEMLFHQKQHNIIRDCGRNTKQLVDQINYLHDKSKYHKELFKDMKKISFARIEAVVFTGYDTKNDQDRIITHLVVDYDGEKLDPSYETKSMQDKKYYGSPKEFYRTDERTNSLTFKQKLQIENEYNTMHFNAINLNKMSSY